MDSKKELNIEDLEKVCEFYKKKFAVTFRYDIAKQGFYCRYDVKLDWIGIALDCILKKIEDDELASDLLELGNDLEIRGKGLVKSKNQKILFSVLHEIGHAIDTDRINEEIKYLDKGLYHDDREYHHSRPFEKRADRFARQELKNWKDLK